MKRVRFEVLPAGRLGWKITRDRKKALHAPRKRAMVKEAVLLAHIAADHGSLVTLKIKGRDGRILEERTYPRSSDPRHTKG